MRPIPPIIETEPPRDSGRLHYFRFLRVGHVESLALTPAVEFGAEHGNYEEFRFFTGLRQSEEIALTVEDCDLAQGKVVINKAVVLGREKDRTNTGEDREIRLCRRALDLLNRQLALRDERVETGKIDHDLVFSRTAAHPSRICPIRTTAGVRPRIAAVRYP